MSGMLMIRDYNGVEILQREDGYLNATAMCKANGKLFADYARLKSTEEYLQALSGSMGNPIDLLIQQKVNGANDERGTFVHRLVAIHLAQWLSPAFAVQVSKWTEELLTRGTVNLGGQKRQDDLLAEVASRLAAIEGRISGTGMQVGAPLLDPRQVIWACWPDAGNIVGLIVRRMNASYLQTLARPAPQSIAHHTAPLMCEPQHVSLLMEAIGFYWRKEHRAERPQLPFVEVA